VITEFVCPLAWHQEEKIFAKVVQRIRGETKHHNFAILGKNDHERQVCLLDCASKKSVFLCQFPTNQSREI